jgi:protein-tyrosine phosphatase
MDRVELHFHLLPGLDDGPATLAESVALAAAAQADGTQVIVTTPHVSREYVPDVAILPELVAETQSALRAAGLPIGLHCGAELAHDRIGRLSQEELETIAQGPRNRRWLLVEASLGGLTDEFTLATDELRERGFAVIVAHPERSLAVSGSGARSIIAREVEAGSALQLNAWSLTGGYGETVRTHAERLLDASPRVVVASDAHGSHRPPSFTPAREALDRLGDRQAERRCSALPAALLTHGLRAQAAVGG